METIDRVSTYLGATCIGLGLGVFWGYNLFKPNEVIPMHLNEDKKIDLVVKDRGVSKGNNYIFLQQEDGTYKTLDQVFENSAKVYEQNKKSIEAKVDSLY